MEIAIEMKKCFRLNNMFTVMFSEIFSLYKYVLEALFRK